MTATPISYPPRKQATVEQLQAIANVASAAADDFDDDDYRAYFLAVLETLDWTATDRRWRSAIDLLRHDDTAGSGTSDALVRELRGLLVRITDQAQDMTEQCGQDAADARLRQEARELRVATDRLCSIVYAVTAVHTLGEAAS